MRQTRRKQTLGRRIKRALVRRTRYSPLLRLLVLKPWFRTAFLLTLGLMVFMALYLPKIWRTSPDGFNPEIRISWLDMTQCWSLKRAAKKAEASGNHKMAEHSWRMAVAQNPSDLPALRGYLNNFIKLKHPDKTQSQTALGQMVWLLRITSSNKTDVLQVVKVCDQFGWYEPANVILEVSPDDLSPEAEIIYLKSLFHLGKFTQFRKRWEEAKGHITDPSLELYERAYAMGWRVGEEAKKAQLELAAAGDDPLVAARAARLFTLAAEQQGNADAYEQGLQRLTVLNEARVDDHARLWALLASHGRKAEAIRFAEDFTSSPQNPSELIRLADVLFRLGMTNETRQVLSRFVPAFSASIEAWTYYAAFLQEIKDWPGLRTTALQMRDEASVYGKLWGYSYFLEGLADYRLDLLIGAEVAFKKVATATFENPSIGYRVAKELIALRYFGTALSVLQGLEDRSGTSSEFWETYFEAAYGARDSVAVLTAAVQSYKLKPRDPQIHNRYAAALMLNRKDPQESIKLTLQLYSAYPQSIGAAINHSYGLLLNRRDEEARQLLESLSGRTLSSEEANALHLGLFEVYCNLQLWDKAWAEADAVDVSTLFPNQLQIFNEKRTALPERVTS